MAQNRKSPWMSPITLSILLTLLGCKENQKQAGESPDLPDLNAQIRPYTTAENTKVRAGPGPQFRTIGELRREAKVQVVGRDGDWVLIVSKKGNPPGYIEMASVEPSRSKGSIEPSR
ncbi:MAG TPA: SH3 domain-containing protein, partial [Candidatus Binatia bacterium]|nr:SH3 domain-containing protein [Candidatus Binatia bacterium]